MKHLKYFEFVNIDDVDIEASDFDAKYYYFKYKSDMLKLCDAIIDLCKQYNLEIKYNATFSSTIEHSCFVLI